MNLITEISDDVKDEVIIRCKSMNDEVRLLQDVIANIIDQNAKLVLTSGDSEYFVPRNDIMFFESSDGRTAAHTADKMLYTEYKLYELEKILSSEFVRISKSCIVNCTKVASVDKNLAGASEIFFNDSHKKVWCSRMYYKIFREKMDEMRYYK